MCKYVFAARRAARGRPWLPPVGSMFSAQQPQSSTPWSQKSVSFGATAPSGTPGAGPATPAHPAPNTWLQTQSAWGGMPGADAGAAGAAGAPHAADNSQHPGAPGWGAVHGFGGSAQHAASPGGAPGGAPPHLFPGAQASPVQQSQAPVSVLPGYLSKLRGGDRGAGAAHRTLESASPPAARGSDADTSLSLSAKDAPAGVRAPLSASPTSRFSSSFFNAPRASGDERFWSSRSPAAGREGSIFGSGGLRGSRRVADVGDVSTTQRAPGSPLAASPATLAPEPFPLASNIEDDDAPPQDALTDGAPGVAPAAATAAAAPAATATTAAAPAAAPLAKRVVLVFGFPRYMRATVVDLFAALGGLQSVEDLELGAAEGRTTRWAGAAADTPLDTNPSSTAAPATLRLTYAEPYQALHALRRSGEPLAESFFLGVRWFDDGLHQLSLVQGLDAPLHTEGASDRVQASGKTAPSTPAPTTPATGGAPRFGRPLSVVGTPATKNSVFAASPAPAHTQLATPLRAVMHAGEALWKGGAGAGSGAPGAAAPGAPGAPAPSSGMLGRVADALFGW